VRLYVGSLALIILTVSPRILNVFLAWITEVLAKTPFGLVCVCMFTIGMLLFLLPVVPGAPIFFFGGALLPLKCFSLRDATYMYRSAAWEVFLGTAECWCPQAFYPHHRTGIKEAWPVVGQGGHPMWPS